MLKGQKRVRCFGCFKFGHKFADCWYAKQGLGITATQIVSAPVSNRLFFNLNNVCAECNMICCACKESDNTKSNSYSNDQTYSILSENQTESTSLSTVNLNLKKEGYEFWLYKHSRYMWQWIE